MVKVYERKNCNAVDVVGVTGEKGAGKDTAAKILSSLYGYHRVALADPIRAAVDDLGEHTKAVEKELAAHGRELRWAHQRLGTEARRAVGADNCWVDVALAKIEYFSQIHPVARTKFVVPDVSYPHEVEALDAYARETGGGFRLLRMAKPGDPAPAADDAVSSHCSEEGRRTIPADWTIDNPFTIEGLHDQVEDFVHDCAPRRWVLGDWSYTYTGRRFYPRHPFHDGVTGWGYVPHTVKDVARALAMTARFGGHISHFYSVAQHCVLVARTLRHNKFHARVCLQGLLHDQEEAFTHDVNRPLKLSPCMAGYRRLASRVRMALLEGYGLPPELDPAVKKYDDELLVAESKALQKWPVPYEWQKWMVGVDEWKGCPQGFFGRVSNKIRPWSWRKAEREFLYEFDRLSGAWFETQ